MAQEPLCRRTYTSINRPLTIWGADRRLFLLALMIGAGAFNFFGSLFLGIALFLVLYALARWTMAVDPQLPRILLNSTKSRTRYDALRAQP
jgi:type IV secretory pathway TrbD component